MMRVFLDGELRNLGESAEDSDLSAAIARMETDTNWFAGSIVGFSVSVGIAVGVLGGIYAFVVAIASGLIGSYCLNRFVSGAGK